MRFIVGGIMHETHTFSSEPTTTSTLPTFRGDELLRYAGVNHSLGGTLDACRDLGIAVAPTFFADGVSTGTPDRATFEALAGELLRRIAAALPADGIVLNLHGAMVAEDFPDAEAEIVRRVRDLVGSTTPIAVTLDFHANLGQAMVEACDLVTTYDTYPHIDAAERAREAVQLLARTVRGEIRPTMALAKPPLLPVPQAMFTARPPFKTLLDRAHDMEERGEALAVTVAGGFPYSDVPEAGVGALVVTDNDPRAARRLADDLAALAWELRGHMQVANRPPREAVAEAIAYPTGPVMLVDVGDNIGGGTTGDGTALLAELIAQDARDAVVVIADPESAEAAIAVGVGAMVDLSVGGKVDQRHGEPVAVRGVVRRITDGRWIHEGPENAGAPADMGPTAVVAVGGVDIVLTSCKSMPGDLAQLRSVGIEPAERQIIVVKSAVRWRGGYGPIAKHAIDVDTPGLGSVDLSRFEFRRLRRPIWPLDPDFAWSPEPVIGV
ncbi:MAG: M81 family metallopeptidase [Thermomicrobiales bacterium]|nr:M81 family metallopeptidase [Thermomicrobiales bacterium]